MELGTIGEAGLLLLLLRWPLISERPGPGSEDTSQVEVAKQRWHSGDLVWGMAGGLAQMSVWGHRCPVAAPTSRWALGSGERRAPFLGCLHSPTLSEWEPHQPASPQELHQGPSDPGWL